MGLILTRQPTGVARLKPEFFDRSALCFLPNSLHVRNLAKSNAGKVLTRVSPTLKGSPAGRGVGCSNTTRAYLDTDWIDPVATSDGTGTGAFSLLFCGTLAAAAGRTMPFHTRQNSGNFNSVFVVQNGYYAEGGTSSLYESGSVWLGTYDGTVNNARGLKIASALTATPTTITLLYNRNADGTSSLWSSGVQVAANAVGYLNDLTVGTAMHLSLGGLAHADGSACPDPTNLVYIANRSFSDAQSSQLSRNPWQIFQGQDERLWASVAEDGSTGTLAATNANDSVSAAGTTTVTGTTAKTNADDTVSASGTTTIVGTSASTNAADTSSAEGEVGGGVSGTLATTNTNDASAAAGTTAIVGTAADTNAADTSAASGFAGSVTGTADVANSNDSVSASGITQSNSGGGIGHGSRKKSVFIERDGKVLVFASAAKAASYIAAEKAAEPVAAPVAAQPPVSSKPAAVAARPVEIITFDAIADLLRKFSLAPNITEQIQRHELDAVMALYRRARDLQDEEDIELLLLAA